MLARYIRQQTIDGAFRQSISVPQVLERLEVEAYHPPDMEMSHFPFLNPPRTTPDLDQMRQRHVVTLPPSLHSPTAVSLPSAKILSIATYCQRC
jgi:hypothetical protein